MKKFLLLLSAASLVALSGCSSDSDSSSSTDGNGNGDGNVTVTNIDMSNPDTLIGTYKIEYFASSAGAAGGAASSWKELKNYNNVLSEDKQVQGPSNIDKPDATFGDAKGNFFGEVSIKYDNTKANLLITSKLQMKDTSFSTTPILDIKLSDQQYNYTVYTPIPKEKINAKDNTINYGENAIVGVTGRDAVKVKPTKVESGKDANTYEFKLHTDKMIYHSMVDKSSLLPAKVLVVLKKVNDEPKELKANVQYTNKETGKNIELTDFAADPAPAQ